MSWELLREFIAEAVIDASGSFAAKRAGDFRKKVQGALDDLPNAFQRQAELERDVNFRLAPIEEIPDRFVNPKRLRLAVPGAFTDDEFGPGASVFSAERDPHWAALRRFVTANAVAFRRALQAVEQALDDVQAHADEMEWPASWRRYTQWGYVAHNVQSFADKLKRLMA